MKQLVVLDQHVPSVLEYLDGIWGDSYSVALCTSELLVRHQQFVVLFHTLMMGCRCSFPAGMFSRMIRLFSELLSMSRLPMESDSNIQC